MSAPELSEEAYRRELLRHVRKVASRLSPRPAPLLQYVRKSLGAYPSDVKQALDAQSIAYDPEPTNAHAGTELAPMRTEVDNLLADEHPNDYDWRFSDETVQRLVQKLARYRFKENGVALFGVKTLLTKLIQRGIPAHLFERSASLVNDLKKAGFTSHVTQHDLLHPLNHSGAPFNLVIADPPWYMDHYEAYLNRSVELLGNGGELWLSVLPPLTRPSARQDRRDIQALAVERGFVLRKKSIGWLGYKTPHFESKALTVSRMNLGTWRLGELWIFQTEKPCFSSVGESLPSPTATWLEFRILNKKVHVREELEVTGLPFDYWPTSAAGKVFPSVSRRTSIREQITVWTSDNVAFSLSSSDKLVPFLRWLESSLSLAQTLGLIRASPALSEPEKTKMIALLHDLELVTA